MLPGYFIPRILLVSTIFNLGLFLFLTFILNYYPQFLNYYPQLSSIIILNFLALNCFKFIIFIHQNLILDQIY